MNAPSKKLLALFRLAAEQRALGKSWEAVAEAVQRQAATCRSWPTLYRSAWQRCLRAALKQREIEVGCEAREFLRKILREEDPKLVVAAAHHLLPQPKSRPP